MKRRFYYVIIPVVMFLALCGSYPFLSERLHNKRNFFTHLMQGYISPINLRLCFCSPDRDLYIRREDGLKTAANLYIPKQEGKRPGVVLIHGNTPFGRKLPFYKVLAKKLSRKGFYVLTLDLVGFGESENVSSVEEIWNFKEIDAAIEVMCDLEEINLDKIFLIGHSRGGAPAFEIGLRNSNVKKIIAIGPSRRVRERILLEDSKDREYFWNKAVRIYQQVYKSKIPEWYTFKQWISLVSKKDLERYIPYFSCPGHKPVFFIDGSLENKKDILYLREYYNRIEEPKKYFTVQNSDHYGNTTGIIGTLGMSIYDKKVMNQMVKVMADWLMADNVY